jgi:hypothetical protein
VPDILRAILGCFRNALSQLGAVSGCLVVILGCLRLFQAVSGLVARPSPAVTGRFGAVSGSFRQFQGSLGLFQVFLSYVGAVVGCSGAFLESLGSRFRSFQGCCEASRDILRLFCDFMRFQAIQEQFLGHFQAIFWGCFGPIWGF